MTTLFHTKIEPKKELRKAKLLDEAETLIPWWMMAEKINSKLPIQTTWRPRIDTVILLKVMFLQYVFWLADESVEEDIYDRATFRSFLWNKKIIKSWVPDATTLCRFRSFLEENNLHEILFEQTRKVMEERWLILKVWTIVDATIITAPSSTKNKEKQRDPEMRSTKKGANYSFGMKIHIWTDMTSWVVHTLGFTSANVHDSQMTEKLLHWEEKIIGWDKWYANWELKSKMRKEGKIYAILDKSSRGKNLSNAQIKRNKKRQSIRAKVERPFRVFKKWRWNKKVRYRWIAKNSVWITCWFMFGNYFLAKRYLQRVS